MSPSPSCSSRYSLENIPVVTSAVARAGVIGRDYENKFKISTMLDRSRCMDEDSDEVKWRVVL